MTVFVEVHVVTEPEDEEENADDCAYDNHPKRVFNAGDIGFVACGLCSGLCIGLLSFHVKNLIREKMLSIWFID